MNTQLQTARTVEEPEILRPWQGSGIEVVDSFEAEDIMAKAELNWTVEGRPLYYSTVGKDDIMSLVASKTHKAIVRNDNNVQLGTVGKNWQILQNWEVFKFLDELVSMGLVKYSSAGSFKNGKIIYVQCEFCESEILPGDVHKKYLLFTNAFDGTFSVRIGWTDIRVACWNTLMNAIHSIKKAGKKVKSFVIRHTASMKAKIEEAKKALVQAEAQGREFDMFQRALTRVRMTSDMWKEFGETLIPDPEEGKNKTRAENARNELMALSVTGRGQDIPGVAGTAYAALNGLTEYVNYHRSTRGDDAYGRQANRFQATLFGSGAAMINQGLQVLGGFATKAGIQVDTVVPN
ncbi:MAG: DUF932 domain-containing protein [Anaerolineaceae bacterium]|nr:DUF932 domain-containing protein [Anaerolineaceae bacterium]